LNRIVEWKTYRRRVFIRRVKMDNKDFGIGAQILHDIDISKLD
jgi:3,4-dihydroxy 2-butanone 4-phosphate synthase/GTP cyclohydrolase II